MLQSILPHYHWWGVPPSYVHLVLRPRVWARCVLTAHGCVCGALPYSFEWTGRPQTDQDFEKDRMCRTKGGRCWMEFLLIILPGQSCCFFLNVLNLSMHADIIAPPLSTPDAVGLGQT